MPISYICIIYLFLQERRSPFEPNREALDPDILEIGSGHAIPPKYFPIALLVVTISGIWFRYDSDIVF
jgi:hypothetical protein